MARKFDPEKRKIVMGRSRRLGHCICNPKEACPCPVFAEKNVCLCAGERLPDTPDTVKLTDYVESAGCASKINQSDLKIALEGLPAPEDPFYVVMRIYWPEKAALDGTWTPPPVVRIS